jgi:hypothetical protein
MSLISYLAHFTACFLTIELASAASSTTTETYNDNNPLCGCYEVNNAGSPVFFHNYRFYDFSHWGVADNATEFYSEPDLVTQSGGNESITNEILSQPPFSDDWQIQAWGSEAASAGLNPRWNSPQNVFIRKFSAVHVTR